MLHERPDYKGEAQVFDRVLQSAIPVLDRTTEEGTRFRVYKIGNLEVRTIQEVDGKEVVVKVFSLTRCAVSRTQDELVEKMKSTDKIAKVTMYVEKNRLMTPSL